MATKKDPIKEQEEAAKLKKTGIAAALFPIVGVPAMAVFFATLGGGAGTPANAAVATQAGLNLELPKAANSTILDSKLASTGRQDTLRNRDLLIGVVTKTDSTKSKGAMAFGIGADGAPISSAVGAEQTAEAAKKQLAFAQQLQKDPGTAPAAASYGGGSSSSSLTPQQQLTIAQDKQKRDLELKRTQEQIERLNTQMNVATATMTTASKPVVAVAVVETKKKPALKTKASLVNETDAVVSRFGNDAGQSGGAAFQGFDANSGTETDANTLPAVIHESVEVTSGSLVKMRLTEAAVVDGHKLAANTFIYGKCALAGERLTISIVSLKSGGNIFPAALEVFDVDGLPGLHIPGAIERDQAKQAGAQGISGLDMMTMSSNPAAMAAGVAVGALKNVGTAKIRQVKVKLKAGYNLMLKVEKD